MKDIVIKKEDGEETVFVGIKKVGTLRKFCCGIDFAIENKKAMFTILSVYKNDEKLITCLSAILSLKIPRRSFHANFRLETALDKKRLSEYEKALNKPKAE